jgi:hypothetical integral membrane protein (TIGR02206 family)
MRLSAEYVLPLIVGALAVAVLTVLVRLRPGTPATITARLLAVFVLGSEIAWLVYDPLHGHWSAAEDLPLHLSDVAPLVAAAALWWRRRLLVEVIYFWAVAGGLQALITPSIGDRFPGFLWWQYYAVHTGVVAAAAVLVAGFGIQPARGAVARVFALSAAYTLCVGTVDALTGANYMFLRRPPPDPTLLSLFAPWPWYIAEAAVVCVILFLALDLPFAFARVRSARAARSSPTVSVGSSR